MVQITINGTRREIGAPDDMPLLWVIRDILGLKGTKFGCGAGLCGACTVHLNGEPVRACQTHIVDAEHGTVTTIEHVGDSETGVRVLQAWLEVDVPQCGYCQPGQIMSATALLADNHDPDDDAITAAMEGNICRCGTYNRIRAAIRAASGDKE